MAAGRLLAVVQAVLWLVLLIDGGIGLVLGPLALGAALLVRRHPVPAVVFLAGPLAWLLVSWVPGVIDPPAGAPDVTILLLLTVPGAAACVIFMTDQMLATEPSASGRGEPRNVSPASHWGALVGGLIGLATTAFYVGIIIGQHRPGDDLSVVVLVVVALTAASATAIVASFYASARGRMLLLTVSVVVFAAIGLLALFSIGLLLLIAAAFAVIGLDQSRSSVGARLTVRADAEKH
jgi:hypothetical protein